VHYLSIFCQTHDRRRISRVTLSTVFTACVLACLILIGSVRAWNDNTAYNVPIGMDTVGFPTVALDNGGYAHVAWMRFHDDFKTGDVFYIRGRLNADGTAVSWESLQKPLPDVAHRNHPPRLVAQGNLIVLAYGTDTNEFVLGTSPTQGSAGSWTRQQTLRHSGNSRNFGMDIAVDGQGTTYMTWGSGFGDGEPSRVLFSYQPYNGAWDPPIQISGNYFLSRATRVAVNGSGASATVHAVWEYQHTQEENYFSVGYSRGTRDATFNFINFSEQVTGGKEGGGPSLAVGASNRVAVALIKEIRRGAEYTMRFAVSSDDGVTWPAQAAELRIDPTIWPGASWMDLDGAAVHIVAEQKYDGGKDMRITHQSYDLATGQASPYTQISAEENSGAPRLDISAAGKIAIFAANGVNDIKYNVEGGGSPVGPTATPLPSPTPTLGPVPAGTLAIHGTHPAQGMTTDTNVKVEFTVDGGITGVSSQLSNDGQTYIPNEFAPLTSNTVDWQLADAATSACEERTVYARLQNVSGVSEPLSNKILLDPGVDVDIEVKNPYMPSTLIDDAASAQSGSTGGALNGAVNYTRVLSYYGRVALRPGECSGLQEARFGHPNPVNALTAESLSGQFALEPAAPDQSNLAMSDGDYEVAVQVTDGAGNQQSFLETIVLDRSAPQVLNAPEAVLTARDTQGNPITTVHDSILVSLDIENAAVEDMTYGEREDQDFWGLWLANSQEPIVSSDTQALEQLNWQAIPVTQADVVSSTYSLSVPNWSLVRGIAAPSYGEEATYYTYARFLDGAGNPSSEILGPFEVTLTADPERPTVYLPVVLR
jgi:hypothetical protein